MGIEDTETKEQKSRKQNRKRYTQSSGAGEEREGETMKISNF